MEIALHAAKCTHLQREHDVCQEVEPICVRICVCVIRVVCGHQFPCATNVNNGCVLTFSGTAVLALLLAGYLAQKYLPPPPPKIVGIDLGKLTARNFFPHQFRNESLLSNF